MRKILIGVIVFLSLIGTAFFMVNGMQKIKTEGFVGLDDKNTEVDEKIQDLSNVITVTYSNALSNLKKATTTLTESKTNYENKAIALSSSNSSYAAQLDPYDIDYLWTKLGNYAKEENVVIKIDITVSGVSSELYDLNFSVNGDYSNITDFIYDIENDSKLGFKIDDFTMVASTDNTLLATFTCEDIPIDLKFVETTSSDTDTTNSTANNTSTNTTSDTTANTTGNTTAENVLGTNSNPNKSNLTNDEYTIKTSTGE